jgi:hypothetical protein
LEPPETATRRLHLEPLAMQQGILKVLVEQVEAMIHRE